jgi:hypothetical protein
MALIEINKNPSPRDLRWFGVIVAAVLGLIGLVARFLWAAPKVAMVLWIAAAAIFVVYYAVPPLRRWMYIGWMYLVFPIGFVIGHVLLGIAYYLVLTPVGLLMRLFRYDPMTRRFEPDAASYWIERRPADDKKRYFRQF